MCRRSCSRPTPNRRRTSNGEPYRSHEPGAPFGVRPAFRLRGAESRIRRLRTEGAGPNPVCGEVESAGERESGRSSRGHLRKSRGGPACLRGLHGAAAADAGRGRRNTGDAAEWHGPGGGRMARKGGNVVRGGGERFWEEAFLAFYLIFSESNRPARRVREGKGTPYVPTRGADESAKAPRPNEIEQTRVSGVRCRIRRTHAEF